MKIIYNTNGTINFTATRYSMMSRAALLSEIRKTIAENEAFMINWNKRLAALKKAHAPSE
jgi:hypothetical protein